MALALEYAKALKKTTFEKLITDGARKIYGNDKNSPSQWEPGGTGFLSPSLEEADLMRRILPGAVFTNWFNQYISPESMRHFIQLPVVSDRTDMQIVHLDGLCFSRSWCMNGIAAALPATDQRKEILQHAAIKYLQTALPHMVGGNYGGEYWLASFAVLALLQ